MSWFGDRICLSLRQPHSRLSASRDEPCFFSVSQDMHLKSRRGEAMRRILHKYKISTERIPRSLLLYEDDPDVCSYYSMYEK